MPEQQDDQGWQEALQRIEESKQSGSTILDLGGLDLTVIPGFVAQLSKLEYLNLRHNQLTAIPDSLAQLSNLRELYLQNNQLTAIPDSLARLSNLQTLKLSSNQLTAMPDSLAGLSNLQDLDLSNNQFTAIPDSLAQLTNLQKLNLSSNQFTAIPDSLAQLTNLQKLNLSSNQFTAIPDFLARLSNLQNLDLSNNRFTAIPESLAKLTNLQELYLYRNQLTAIPEHLNQLTKLRILSVSSSQLTAIPGWLARLSNLRTLYLYGNHVTAIPDSLALLSNLEALYFHNNQLTAIPDSLGQLFNLQKLYLSHNQLTAIPDSLGQLSNLRTLDLSNNQLTTVPDSLGELSNLQSLNLSDNRLTTIRESAAQLSKLEDLNLSHNQLAAIPDSLAHLSKLETLILSNNKLTAIPDSLRQLRNLTRLSLHGNPGLGVPDEILGPQDHEIGPGESAKPPREILEYLSKLGDSKHLNEAKLIMVGLGGVGKTSLVKTLTTGSFDRGEETTPGIKISDWTCPITSKDKVTVHIWDFGGQEMMHATHQFFLTQRSLYLLVLNRRQGGVDREADYWFRLIRAFGGKDAPVIVVLNKQKSEPFDVNRGGWLEKYAGNIKGFVGTDCTDEKSITLLEEKIQEELQSLKSIKVSFPRRWFAIKNELSQMASQFITFEDYRAICRKHKEDNPESQTSLAGFLHDLGIALNYKDDPRLRFAYVLKPEWVTEGIYALLHAFVANKGLFTRPEAEKVLNPKGYSSEAAEFIMGLMEQFELSFPLGDNQKRVLIPQLLDDQQPDEALTFKATECLNFGYQHTIVPEGVLPRFIVRTHHLSKAVDRWKSGVILHDENSGCRALVRADPTEGQVRIHIDGTETTRRELLAIVRYNFDVIHSDYEFRPRELVYPQGVPDRPLRLDDLETMARSGTTSMPVVLGDSRVINPTIASLVEPIQSLLVPLKLFLSYSHKDEKYLDELRKRLRIMERNGRIRAWHDRALTAGEEWEPRILQELNNADVIVCQLSPDFLNSDYCMLKELPKAFERKSEGKAELVAYVLRDCLWKDTDFRHFQILPRGAKHLRAWRDPDEYWTAVTEGIQEALTKLQKQREEKFSYAVKARLSEGDLGR